MTWIKISLSKRDLAALNKAEKQVKNLVLLKRIQCIKLKDKDWKNTDLAEFFGVCANTITNWQKTYRERKLLGLLQWSYQGRTSLLTKEHQNKIKARQKERPFDTAKEAKAFLKKECNLDFHLHWVQKLLKKNFNFLTKKPELTPAKFRMNPSKENL